MTRVNQVTWYYAHVPQWWRFFLNKSVTVRRTHCQSEPVWQIPKAWQVAAMPQIQLLTICQCAPVLHQWFTDSWVWLPVTVSATQALTDSIMAVSIFKFDSPSALRLPMSCEVLCQSKESGLDVLTASPQISEKASFSSAWFHLWSHSSMFIQDLFGDRYRLEN